ncbi:hypothetical protein [Bacillus sp. FSL M7-1345]|uniref:hypothetical protein n=1 Tax=Bacillus sp. FSL M7-1345 TaxID=2921541 RepID=UPI0030FBFE15
MRIKAKDIKIEENFGALTPKKEVKPAVTVAKHETELLTDPSNVAQRDKYVERIEVLSKVGGLLLLEGMEMATTKQVATFYNVEHHVIRDVIKVHGDELKQDGMYLAKYGEIKDEVNKDYSTLLESGVSYRGTYLFPRRSILRIGMLLRDSDVAKEVRTQLLNIEEKTEVPTKVIEVNKELGLQAELGKAFMSGDITALAQATARLSEYKNRLITEIEGERDEYKAELDVINGTDLISLKNVGLEYLGGISSARIRKFLQCNGVLGNVKADGHYTANVKYAKYFKLSTTVKNDRLCKTLKATREGASFIADLYTKHNSEKSA